MPVCKRQVTDSANYAVSQIKKNNNTGQSALVVFLKLNKILENLEAKLHPKLWPQICKGKIKNKTRESEGKLKNFSSFDVKVSSCNWLHVYPEIQFLKLCISMKTQNQQNHLSAFLATDRRLGVCSEWTHHFPFAIFPLLRFYFGILYMWGIWTWKV